MGMKARQEKLSLSAKLQRAEGFFLTTAGSQGWSETIIALSSYCALSSVRISALTAPKIKTPQSSDDYCTFSIIFKPHLQSTTYLRPCGKWFFTLAGHQLVPLERPRVLHPLCGDEDEAIQLPQHQQQEEAVCSCINTQTNSPSAPSASPLLSYQRSG